MIVQKLIRSPECAHGAQDTGDPGRRQVLQNAQIVFFGGTRRSADDVAPTSTDPASA